ncbi:MAG TPA: hypothetical protein VM869_35835 [Enhygromyxa sp.]|jgi:hypothetical protein|nr:hypothetical protein [Enhygromyxa sp.]
MEDDSQIETTVDAPGNEPIDATADAPVDAPAAQPPPPTEQTDLEKLLAQARTEERERVLAEQAEAKARAEAEAAEAERQRLEAAAEEQRRTELSEAERAKLDAEEQRKIAAAKTAEVEAAEAKAAAAQARADMLSGLVDSGLQLQGDPAAEALVLERIGPKLAAGKPMADALKELRAENPWLFRGTEQRTNVGGNPGGRGQPAPTRPEAPKKFDAMTATRAELRQRMREIERQQREARRPN